MIPTVLCDIVLSLKNDVNVSSKSNKQIHMFLGLPDPDPLVRGTDPDPFIIKQK